MWKKSDEETPEAAPQPTPSAPRPSASPAPRAGAATGGAAIGPSIRIQGDLTGNEDLTIHGRVEGTVRLEENHVTVGPDGRMKGDIHGRSIHVEGEVRGDLFGSEAVILRAAGRVQGNIQSPRVSLENGSHFKGSIDMEAREAKKSEPEKETVARPASERTEAAAAKDAEAKSVNGQQSAGKGASDPSTGGKESASSDGPKGSPHTATSAG